ncbi:hypothetical protein J3Q64DRAFT_1828373 [Phycomyces blakesleeanus]|uniref:Retrotransposon gag domain-containing protein n=1 Tax=Phycomyces blakesleeanus TaxID=4837 RepID=A0ABR3BG86_PHYBL
MTEHSQHNPLSRAYSTDSCPPGSLCTRHVGMYINSRLFLYEKEATLVGVSSDLLGKFLPHYLPSDIGEWIRVSRTCHDWTALTDLLTSTYGLNLEIEKAQCCQALQSTKQGTLLIRIFQVKFATLANDIPASCRLSERTVLAIFMDNIKPQLRQLMEPTLTKYDSWESAYATAVKHEDRCGEYAPPPAFTPLSSHAPQPMDCLAAIYSSRPHHNGPLDGVPRLWGAD